VLQELNAMACYRVANPQHPRINDELICKGSN
jgi:hypothetical protein